MTADGRPRSRAGDSFMEGPDVVIALRTSFTLATFPALSDPACPCTTPLSLLFPSLLQPFPFIWGIPVLCSDVSKVETRSRCLSNRWGHNWEKSTAVGEVDLVPEDVELTSRRRRRRHGCRRQLIDPNREEPELASSTCSSLKLEAISNSVTLRSAAPAACADPEWRGEWFSCNIPGYKLGRLSWSRRKKAAIQIS
ncbi:hypothetical protein CPC08DRAFT_726390 [Agrocybe pediades]|nr:hypothetical protein CPC08DRAFT_726390 [Agrocybe pediades]